MSNRDTAVALSYHEQTKHSHERLQASRHSLDWDNQPLPYKIYSTLQRIPLPTDFPGSGTSALDAIATIGNEATRERVPDLPTVASLCFFSNGITKRLGFDGHEMPFRAASTTGALYHVELYVVCGDLPGLPAGVYHYASHDHALRRLRVGDYRGALVDASGSEPSLAQAPLVLATTSTFWRNAWKYQARAYRHTFWDSGTILANLLAMVAAHRIPSRLVLGFADQQVNRLLGADGRREAAVSLVALGRTPHPVPPPPAVEPLDLPTEPLSRSEVEYREIVEMHAASCLLSADEAAEWRRPPPSQRLPGPSGPLVDLRPLQGSSLPDDSIEQVIRRRGSSRRFSGAPVRFDQLSTILDRSSRGMPTDYRDDTGPPLSDVYLIVNAVDGLQPGAYVLRREGRALQLLAAAQRRDEAGTLALGQALGRDAAVNVYFLSDLAPVLSRFGNRGYRAAQLSSAIEAGKLYLAAYALGLGSTGLTFFDDDVTRFFSPHASNKSVMFLLALGQPTRRKA